MATLVGRHRRSRRGNRCSNARLSRSPSAPGGQIVRTGRRGRRDHLQNSRARSAGPTKRCRGGGPPLVLMPLSLAPSQWDPLIATLSARYCTISLGGPLLGGVGILEECCRSYYLAMVESLV